MTDKISVKESFVFHIGRCGDVAGGMTQVINSYLDWDFSNITVEVIVSRNGAKGIKGLLVFLKAWHQVVLMPLRRGKKTIVVHLSQGGSFIREGVLLVLASFYGYRTVAQLHGSRFASFYKRHPFLVKLVLSHATKVHVLSEETRDIVRDFKPQLDVVYLPNAVPAGNPTKKQKLIVFGGAVTRRKGVDLLIQAWQSMATYNGWKLIIAGPVMEQDLRVNGLSHCEFAGSLSHKELMRLLDQAAVAVLPSRDEAMPMFILEALARHCCVISTYVGGIPKVLSDDRGILIQPDADELRLALATIVADEGVYQRYASKGHDSFLNNFSAHAIYPKLEDLWLGLS
ncbi:MAG: glycosyltransferase family 4 protein [Pseudomonadales bacterium]|nr:glycosyltransferase family 4 protein [Pseudomonadales bacterium]